MAVSAVKIVSIIGIMPELDHVIDLCGKSEIFQPDNALSFYSDTHNFIPLFEENPYDEPLKTLVSTIGAAEKTLTLAGAEHKQMGERDIKDYVTYVSSSLGALLDKRASIKQELDRCSKSIVEISHFTGLGLDLAEIFACRYIKVRFGRLPKENYDKLDMYHDNPYVLFFPCTSDQTHYWGVYISPVEYVDEVDRIFSSLFFERLKISAVDSTPEQKLELLNKEMDGLHSQLEQVKDEIDAFWNREAEKCDLVYTILKEFDTYFGIRRYAAKYNNSFILTGWIPEVSEKDFTAQLDKVDGIQYSIENAQDFIKHSPPVKLKNARLFRPFEFFVDMFGLPNYSEIDPTVFVGITYILLFGIMFGDLGQGLVLSGIGYLMWRIKRMSLGKIMVRCGISSAVFGLVFGSVFGFEETLNPLYRLIGFEEKPISVMEPQTTNYIIYAAVGIGVLLVLVAMLLNIYSSCKQKNYESAIFGANGIAGFVFYSALVSGMVAQLVLHIHLMNPFYVTFFLCIPLILIFFREPLGKLMKHDPDWKPESWGDYCMQNFFEVFEVLLSYVTNTMSFLRVGAFVLVHAGMMMVVFTLAEMSAGVGYIAVVIIGNAIVMALEGLLVGIQVLRLEFYEMFSRFFEGGGRPYKPVAVHNRID